MSRKSDQPEQEPVVRASPGEGRAMEALDGHWGSGDRDPGPGPAPVEGSPLRLGTATPGAPNATSPPDDGREPATTTGPASSPSEPPAERPAAFDTELVEALDRLLPIARHLTRCEEAAQDLRAATYARALEKWHRYQLGTNMTAWLARMMTRLYIGRLRRKDLPIAADVDVEETGARADMDDEPSFMSLDVSAIRRAVDEAPLSPREREVFLLFHFRGRSYREIADALGISIGFVGKCLHYARRRLRTFLIRLSGDDDERRDLRGARRPGHHQRGPGSGSRNGSNWLP